MTAVEHTCSQGPEYGSCLACGLDDFANGRVVSSDLMLDDDDDPS